MRFFGCGVFHGALPQQFAVESVETKQRAFLFFFQRLSDEDFLIPNDGRGVAAPGHLDFPRDIVRGTPLHGQIFIIANAQSGSPSPHRPVFRVYSNCD